MKKHVSWVLGLGSTLALLGSTGCKQTSSSEGESSSCPEGQAECGDECVTLSSDPQHCGACGRPCPTAASCRDGECSCQTGLSLCGAGCVDLQGDGTNCGDCGKACATGTVCSSGVCGATCAASGQTMCGQSCVDLTQNPAHCGACDIACPATQLCVEGSCSCGPSLIACEGACVDPATNSSHCGRGVHLPDGAAALRGVVHRHVIGRVQLRRLRSRVWRGAELCGRRLYERGRNGR
jgi:hypothetical protein